MGAYNLELLSTIYDSAAEITPGIYGVKLNGQYGLVNDGEVVLSPEYTKGYFRHNYAILGHTDRGTSATSVKEPDIVLIYNSNKKYLLNDISKNSIKEYPGTEFRLLKILSQYDPDKITVDSNGTKVQNSTNGIIVDTLSGEELLEFPVASKISYRPYSNEIIYGIKTPDGRCYGVTKDYKAGLVSDLLKDIYDNVTKIRSTYTVTDKHGNKHKLTEYGQAY